MICCGLSRPAPEINPRRGPQKPLVFGQLASKEPKKEPRAVVIHQTKAALAVVALWLGGCAAGTAVPVSMRAYAEPEPQAILAQRPPNAPDGSCWARDTTPAIIETVTEQILLHPAEVGIDGTVRKQAIYKTETRQAIVRERTEIWFETPCAADLTPNFIASVQRALQARGLYRGHVTSQMDSRTRAAIRALQASQGLDSGILSLAAARQLGLIAFERRG